MGSISELLRHQTVNRSLCCGGRRADVNTAFNYKSNPKRATLHCPLALSTKARPSYPNTPHCTAGNLWPAIDQDKFKTETESSSAVRSVKGMQRMLCSSFVCVCCYMIDRHMFKADDTFGHFFLDFWQSIFYFCWLTSFHQTYSLSVILSLVHQPNKWHRNVYFYPVTVTSTHFDNRGNKSSKLNNTIHWLSSRSPNLIPDMQDAFFFCQFLPKCCNWPFLKKIFTYLFSDLPPRWLRFI